MISSRQNQRIKTIRALRDCKDELALLEGPHLIEEMLGTGLECVEVLATPDFLDSGSGRRIAPRLPTPALEVSPSVLASIADAGSPQGILAFARLQRSGPEALPRETDGVYLFLDRVQDPGNLGALVRSAEATSAAGVALSPGCAHPNHPKALRASAGSLLRVPVAVAANLDAVLDRLTDLSPRVVALAPAGGEDLYQAELQGALVLVLGSEGAGVPADIASRADLRVTIPTTARVESLNVTVAGSVVVHEIARRRRS